MIFKVEGEVPRMVHFPGGGLRMAAWGEMAVSAEDLSSAVFEKHLITRQM